MNTTLAVIAGLILAALAWYGYTYSLTADAFMIQGYIGALIPAGLGAWLFACGWCVGARS